MKTRRAIRWSQRGETLIESMMAMVVVSLGAAGLLRMNVATFQGLAVSSQYTYGTALATNKLHDLLSLPVVTPTTMTNQLVSGHDATNLGSDGTAYTTSGTLITTYNASATDGTFSRSWTVADAKVGGSAVNNIKVITVTVSWFDTTFHSTTSVQATGGLPE